MPTYISFRAEAGPRLCSRRRVRERSFDKLWLEDGEVPNDLQATINRVAAKRAHLVEQ